MYTTGMETYYVGVVGNGQNIADSNGSTNRMFYFDSSAFNSHFSEW